MFIGNFQSMYERPSTAETLKTIRQKHDESLRDYVKYFYNARNAILNIWTSRLSMPSMTVLAISKLLRRLP
jgi:hypothetical protein